MKDDNNNDRHECQRQELTQHTGMKSRSELRQMAMTIVLHTFYTRSIAIDLCVVSVKQRQKKHWHEYCQ